MPPTEPLARLLPTAATSVLLRGLLAQGWPWLTCSLSNSAKFWPAVTRHMIVLALGCRHAAGIRGRPRRDLPRPHSLAQRNRLCTESWARGSASTSTPPQPVLAALALLTAGINSARVALPTRAKAVHKTPSDNATRSFTLGCYFLPFLCAQTVAPHPRKGDRQSSSSSRAFNPLFPSPPDCAAALNGAI